MSQVRGQPEGWGDFLLLPATAKQIPSKLSNLGKKHLIPHTPSEGQGSVCFWPTVSNEPTRQPGLWPSEGQTGPSAASRERAGRGEGRDRGPRPRPGTHSSWSSRRGESAVQSALQRGAQTPSEQRQAQTRPLPTDDRTLQHRSGHAHGQGCAANCHSTAR